MSISRVGTEAEQSWGPGLAFLQSFGLSPHGCNVAAAAPDITSSQNIGIRIRMGGEAERKGFSSHQGAKSYQYLCADALCVRLSPTPSSRPIAGKLG